MSPTISAEERLAVYHQLQVDIREFSDLWLAILVMNFERAGEIAIALSDGLWLLAVDLGWSEERTDEAFELSSPTQLLRRVFTRLLALVEETPERMTPAFLSPEDAHEHVLTIERVSRRMLRELPEPTIRAEECGAVSAALVVEARAALDELSQALREGKVGEADQLANLASESIRMAAEDLRWGTERGDLKLTSSPNALRLVFGRLFGRAFSDPRSLEPGAWEEHGDRQAVHVQEVATRVLDALNAEAR